MPDSDESPPPARRKRDTVRTRPSATDDADNTAAAEADAAMADRERHAELERLRRKLHRKFH